MVKRAENLVQDLYNVFNEVPFAIAILKGEDLIIEFINDYNLAVWQKTKDEVLNKPLFEVFPGHREFAESIHRDIYRTGKRYTARELPVTLTADGVDSVRWFDTIIDPLKNVQGEIVGQLATTIEVTEKVLARNRVQESENRFRTLAEALPQMVWMLDVGGQIEYGSKLWEVYSGINDIAEAWRTMVHPDEWPTIMTSWEEHLNSGTPMRNEVRLKNKEGEYRWHFAVAEPVRDSEGKILKWIGALTDIHSQKLFSEHLERVVEERTRALARSNEDLQQFAHVASHDLKEPVRKIKLFTDLLKTQFKANLPEKAVSYLERIEKSANRMQLMIDGVLRYSYLDALHREMEVVDLNEIILNVCIDLEVSISEKQAFINSDKLPPVAGSSILYYQLWYNLIYNSLKFAHPDRKPEITIRYIGNENGFVKMDLQDNGIGFSQSSANFIFQTFSRLHSKDNIEGTGLGLALCKKIVERFGGSIYAEGKEGVGATFTLLFPA